MFISVLTMGRQNCSWMNLLLLRIEDLPFCPMLKTTRITGNPELKKDYLELFKSK